jgi:endonuclease IV
MKLGVKTYDDYKFLKHFENKCDFFEVQAIESKKYDFLKGFSKSFVLHSQHFAWGINNADKSILRKNMKSYRFTKKLADKYNAKKLIFHPGKLVNENCSFDNAVSFFRTIDDKRIVIENLPGSVPALCTTPEDTKEFLKESGLGFCFDINHAIESATSLKRDYMQMLKDFLKLKPKHYHLGGQSIKNRKTHLALTDLNSDIDIKGIMKLLPKNAEITL